MTQEESQLPRDRFEVLIFTLADHAIVAPDGKLYINGAGVDSMTLPTIPGNTLPLSLALRLRTPWSTVPSPGEFEITVTYEDGSPVIPRSLVSGAAEVLAKPEQLPGDERAASAAFSFQGLPIQREGKIYFHLAVNGNELAVIPLRIARG
jgi:hypothetical protein